MDIDRDGVDALGLFLEASANARLHGWPLGPAGEFHGCTRTGGADQDERSLVANLLSVGATALHPPQRCAVAVVVLQVGLAQHGGHAQLHRLSPDLNDQVDEPGQDPELPRASAAS